MRLGIAVGVLCLSLVGMSAAQRSVASMNVRKPTNIPAQSLGTALETLAKQRDLSVIYRSDLVSNLQSAGAIGELTPEEALGQVLAGTGLTYRYLNETTVTIAVVLGAPHASPTAASASAGSSSSTEDQKEKGGGTFWDRFLVAQATSGQTAGPSTVEKQDEQTKKKPIQLEEVVVTGSRIPTVAGQAPQNVNIYAAEQIEQSGQTTLSDFLNTLPSVSTAVTESGTQTGLGGTTVQLRGLPFGATLVLINGRRVETSGTQGRVGTDFFDLNNIPLSAVERIEVVADGSSAIYGSDAIAGVVNIILKKNFSGLEATTKEGWASDTHESDSSIEWGKQWNNNASFSIVGSYQVRSELNGSQRSLTASNDYTAFGGTNSNLPVCSPMNVYSTTGANLPGLNAPFAAVPAGFSGPPSIQEFRGTAGTLNQCAILSNAFSVIPATHRAGIFAQTSVPLSSSAELFAEFLYSHLTEDEYVLYPFLFGVPGFQQFTVSATNPYNPFGATVGISGQVQSLGRQGDLEDTKFYRPLIGARGAVGTWKWEVAARYSRDYSEVVAPLTISNDAAIQTALNSSNPATALNPFIAGAPGSSTLLRSLFSDGFTTFTGREQAIDGFLRGSPIALPSGAIDVVIGSEYDRSALSYDLVSNGVDPPNTQAHYDREAFAVFAEARVPILANRATPEAAPTLAFTVAGRHDHYTDFGSKNTPQIGGEWRPLSGLLVRATYSEAFKAPPLAALYTPQTTSSQPITDPLTGNTEVATIISGGNPRLHAQTGESHTFGIAYASPTFPDLQLSITQWTVDEVAAIQNLSPFFIASNANDFPGQVIRGSSCASGPPCPITEVIDTFVNFGTINVAGIDYQLNYKYAGRFGLLTTSANAGETYHYTSALTPGVPSQEGLSEALDTGNWAPRWKGTIALGWKLGPYSAKVDGRYVSKYQDYDSTREIGNFWLCDVNAGYRIGAGLAPTNDELRGVYLELGAVNLFNRLPQFSNFLAGGIGYDPTQADIRGRFAYARVGAKW